MSAIQISQLELSNSIYELDSFFQIQIKGGFTPPSFQPTPLNFSFNFSSISTHLSQEHIDAHTHSLVVNGGYTTNNYYYSSPTPLPQ